MMRRSVQFSLLIFLVLSGTFLKAQPSKTLPSNPTEFIEEFTSQIDKFGNKEVQQYTKGLKERWLGGVFLPEEQERLIGQANIMLLKNYNLNPEILNYVKTVEAIKDANSFAQIDINQFFMAADSCVLLLDRKRTAKYYQFMRTFCESGAAFKTSNASWTFSQNNPELKFGTFTDKEQSKTVSFPYLVFSVTDLKYQNAKDSSIVYNTKGQLNIMTKMFDAEGGRIDWSKMGLDPNEVYADLTDYGLNLNYSFIKLDTVIFHYTSLLEKPLKGKFEDINKGFNNKNKANYPYFRSYDGGVVIENFIPNVRYEGGFSLRGIRKIGSAYYQWVDIPEPEVIEEDEPEEEDPYEEEIEETYDEFGYEYDESAFYFDDEDEYLEDTWGDEEPVAESEDEVGGGDFEEILPDMEFLDQELKLMKASLTIFRNEQKTMALRAYEFVLDAEKLVSRRTEVSLYISEEDSITHPSVDVVYDVDSAQVVLMKDVKDKFARQAFLSPYHGYYLYFDAIRWDQKTNKIEFTSLIDKENQTSAIESEDFFKLQRFRQFKSVLKFNPIGAIYRYMNLHPGEPIFAEDICEQYKLPDQLPALLLALPDVEGSGYIIYDKKTHKIEPLPKLTTWAKAARGKKDYDAIQIITQVKSGNNAELDLESHNIDINGVNFFSLSDSQYVRVIPNQNHVKVFENRDLNYDGVMAAGKLNFYGRLSADTAKLDTSKGKFTFQYDNYKILCDSLDSLRFVLMRDPPVGYSFSKLQKALRNTAIEGVTGAIYINKPDNKNGLDQFEEYPVFDSYTNSYVYWAKPNIADGVYAKDKFYFSIDPFVLDSLESFDELSLSFEGEFISSEIFPKIRQRLAVMEDYTLGLKDVTPPDTGYAAYDGAGRFKGEINLDGSGLSSSGEMDFMNTTAKSDSFQMYFDSVKAITEDFQLPKGTRDGANFPQIDAKTVAYKWLTKKDQIELETVKDGEPIILFEGEGYFEGKLIVTKEGLKGSGKLTMGNVTVESDEISFNELDFTAQKGTFTVYDKNNPGKELFVAQNMEVSYDVTKHHSEFQSEDVGKPNSGFPDQQFMSSLGKGVYDKKSNDVRLESRSVKQKDNFFYSTHPKQDSLAFYANTAYYNFDQKEVQIDGVPYIYVADAKITPDSTQGGRVNVKPDGFLQKLKSATIQANLETGYHFIYEANIDITSSKMYTASGKYDYIPVDGKDQYINMTDINVQADTLTVAKGNIPEEQGFYLTDRIFFKGQTFLEANRKFMRFSGEVKVDTDNEALANWIKFDSIVNPDSVFIPIDESALGKLVVGLYYKPRNRVFYSTFLQEKKEKEDKQVALAKGGLTFDRTTNEFRIGPAKKLTGVEYRGTTSSLDDENNIITTVGKLDFPSFFKKNTISMEVAGKWRDDMGNNEVISNLMLKFNMDCIPKEAWDKLADRLIVVAALNEDIPWTDPLFIQSISEYLDPNYKQADKNTQAFLKSVQNAEVPSTDIKVAKEIMGSLLLSGVQFRYDEEYKSLYATGEVGMLGMNGRPVNKMTSSNTKIEYNIGRYSPAGVPLPDTLRIYLEMDEFTQVYFEFSGEVLNTWSTDVEGYNAVLAAEIEKRKKSEGYRFEMAQESDKDDFLSRFVNRYIWRD